MRTAFYAGASGLSAFQNGLDVIGNNLANANTIGYKAQKTSFSQLLASRMNASGEPLVGNGVRTLYPGIDAGEATLQPTQATLDLAVTGNGWFCVQNGNVRQYTKDGAFSISLTGNTAYLVSQTGAYVLDASGQRISVTLDEKSSSIDYDAALDRVGIFTFNNPGALTPASANSYIPNADSGAAVAAKEKDYTVIKGYLEQSNVSLAKEMADLIMAQRGFQLSARVVQTADEVEQTINSLRN
jgi:flagellar basal-body rod protein FlgG